MIGIAIRMLFGDRTKLLGLVFGVAFSCLLITLLTGMFTGMLRRTFAMIDDVAVAEIWVTDPSVEYTEEVAPMSETAVQRVRSAPGVTWAVPLYTGTLRARLGDGRFRSVSVVGVDDATLIGVPASSGTDGRALRDPDAVLVDRISAAGQLRRPDGSPLALGDELWLNDRRAVVAGFLDVAPRFMPKPTVYMTYSQAMRMAPPERRLTSFVLAKPAANHSPGEVAAAIERTTGLRARTADTLRRDTLEYFVKNTDMISHVGLMVLLGMVVGSAVVALLLAMFTAENARHYAAFKAMGATNYAVLHMLMVQAVACGLLGFGIGTGAACLIGVFGEPVGVPFMLAWQTLALTATCVVVICMIAVGVSARPILRLEPGIVFRA
jgi:putative ABC transport system permease protein